MDTFDISALPKEARTWVEERISSGLYDSPRAVLLSAMQALELYELDQKIELGIEQLERGEGRSYDENGLDDLKERIRRRGIERLEKQAKSA